MIGKDCKAPMLVRECGRALCLSRETLLFRLSRPLTLCWSLTLSRAKKTKRALSLSLNCRYKIPTINLHDAVVAVCGPPPQPKCFNATGCFCPHCAARGATGYNFLVDKVIVPALTKLLPP